MFNFYVFGPSYENAETDVLEENLKTLQTLFSEREVSERFLKHDSIWDIEVADGTFAVVVFSRIQDKQFSNQVLPQLFQQITSIEPPIDTINEFNNRYRLYNAFYGINFQGLPTDACINDFVSHNTFKERNKWELTPKTLWERQGELFSRVILCENIEAQIQTLGGKYLNQIIEKIRELDDYLVKNWTEGNFNYRHANKHTSLNITPESTSTMQQEELVNMRVFTLPNGQRKCFELHIKTGNLRFHFYPYDFVIYIGYIGCHLKTSRF